MPRSPERQRLADAIERRDDAVFQHGRVSDALEKLDEQIFDQLGPACRRAREALDEAMAAAPALLVAATLGDPADPDAGPSVAEAEATLKAADQAASDARKARSILREELRHREQQVDQANRAVEQAVKAVVGSEKGAVVDEFYRSGRRTLRLARIMRTIGDVVTGVSADDLGLHLRIGDIAPPGEPSRILYRPDPDWSAAIDQLRSGDPDVELPGLRDPEPDPEPETASAEAA